MPHCPLRLYTNVLYANWGNLEHILLFGNSLSSYASRLDVNDDVKLLQSLQPHWVEKQLPVSKQDLSSQSGYFEQAFNDSTFTYFTHQTLLNLPSPIKIEDDPTVEEEVV